MSFSDGTSKPPHPKAKVPSHLPLSCVMDAMSVLWPVVPCSGGEGETIGLGLD